MDNSLDKKLQSYKQLALEKLQAVLCSIPNQKDFIIQQNLIRPLERTCAASWIRSKGVQRIFKFDEKHPAPRQLNTHVYFISSSLVIFRHVLDQIQAHENILPSNIQSGIKNYHIIVVPNVYNSFHVLLEEEGLYGIVALHKFNWDFIYMDESILSLEIPQVFSDIFINNDTSILSSIAQSFRTFQFVFGKPEVILTFGKYSEKICEMINRLGEGTNYKKHSDFNAMVIIDRNKDYPTCLLTPTTYSGLLLEVFNYRSGEIELIEGTNKINYGKLKMLDINRFQKNNTTKMNIRMNKAYDEIYSENRYKNFSEASNIVRTQAKSLGFEVQNLNKMKLDEMQDFVTKKLPKVTEMKNKLIKHLNVCEEIINALAGNFQKQQSLEEDILKNGNRKQILAKIDEMLTISGHKFNIIRLISLVHLCMGLGIDELSNFIKNYCNMFGHRYLYIFQDLKNAGMLPDLDTNPKNKLISNLPISLFQQTEFYTNANKFKLLNASLNDKQNNKISKLCPSYVFNGLYIPLIAQIASILLKAENLDDLNGKIGNIDNLKILTKETGELKNFKRYYDEVKKGLTIDKFPLKRGSLLIFVVGGLTYAEIAACNMIGKLTGSKIVVSSNCIISGSDLISSAF